MRGRARQSERTDLKIAHVVSGLAPEGGGLTVAVLEIARWQSLLGHGCTILTGDRNGPRLRPDEILHEAGGSILEFPTRGPQKARYMPDFRRYLEHNGR